jgi:competence ComEA-like helix-hairpin-helix protein
LLVELLWRAAQLTAPPIHFLNRRIVMSISFLQSPVRRLLPVLTVVAMLFSLGGTWRFGTEASAQTHNIAASRASTASQKSASPGDDAAEPAKRGGKELSGKLNLNTANSDQLMLLPSVGPAKAERIIEWRNKNGQFRRVADLRRVKGFGYKTLKKLEPFLDVKGETSLAAN